MYRDSWDTPVVLRPAIVTIALASLGRTPSPYARQRAVVYEIDQCALANRWCMPYTARSPSRRQPTHAALRERSDWLQAPAPSLTACATNMPGSRGAAQNRQFLT